MKTIMNKHNSRLKGFLMFISLLGIFGLAVLFLMWNSSERKNSNLTSSANDPSASLVRSKQETPFYRIHFKDDRDFTDQLDQVYQNAKTKNPTMKVKASDRYLVLSTCREEDNSVRSNLYLRQIPDSEMTEFLAKHGDQLNYVATRGQE